MPRGGFGGGGFGRGGGFGMRRYGYPIMGGMGMGMGMGSPLMGGLFAGGLGYLLGSNNSNQQPQQVVQQVPVPMYQQPQAAPAADNGVLAQLKLLGDLHDKGVLTDDEFSQEKKRLLDR